MTDSRQRQYAEAAVLAATVASIGLSLVQCSGGKLRAAASRHPLAVDARWLTLLTLAQVYGWICAPCSAYGWRPPYRSFGPSRQPVC